jgi:hypothetical protein
MWCRQCVVVRVLCVWGDSECQNAAFWHLGSTGEYSQPICNNLIADLLFLRKCHAPDQSLLRLERAQVLGLCPGLPQVQARERGRVPCALFAPHLVPCGTAWHSGAPGVLRRGVGAPFGGAYFRRDHKTNFSGKCHNFLNIPNHTEGLFCHSNHTQDTGETFLVP